MGVAVRVGVRLGVPSGGRIDGVAVGASVASAREEWMWERRSAVSGSASWRLQRAVTLAVSVADGTRCRLAGDRIGSMIGMPCGDWPNRSQAVRNPSMHRAAIGRRRRYGRVRSVCVRRWVSW